MNVPTRILGNALIHWDVGRGSLIIHVFDHHKEYYHHS